MSQHQVKFKGQPKDLAGPELKAGDNAPEFECVTQGLEVVRLGDTPKMAAQIRKRLRELACSISPTS